MRGSEALTLKCFRNYVKTWVKRQPFLTYSLSVVRCRYLALAGAFRCSGALCTWTTHTLYMWEGLRFLAHVSLWLSPFSPLSLTRSVVGDQSSFIIGEAMAASLPTSPFKLQAPLLSINSALPQKMYCHWMAETVFATLFLWADENEVHVWDSPESPVAEPLASGLGTEQCCGHRGRAHCSSA